MAHRYFQTVAGADDTRVGDATQLSGSSMKILIVVLFCFLLISSGAQLGRSGIYHLGLSSFILVP